MKAATIEDADQQSEEVNKSGGSRSSSDEHDKSVRLCETRSMIRKRLSAFSRRDVREQGGKMSLTTKMPRTRKTYKKIPSKQTTTRDEKKALLMKETERKQKNGKQPKRPVNNYREKEEKERQTM